MAIDNHDASRYNDLGNILAQTTSLDLAIEAFKSSLQLNPNDANVWNNLGSVLHRQQLLPEAEQAYRNALTCNAVFVPALNNLAQLLSETGQDEESSRLVCLAYIQPPLTDKPLKLLGVAYFRLNLMQAAAECYRKWLSSEPDNIYAKVHLAASTGENVPTKTPEAYLKTVFDEMSEFFDDKLVNTLNYTGPEIIAKLLSDLPQTMNMSILDGGCGTGLISSVLKRYACALIGVDISAGMLSKAKTRHLYSELIESELVSFLATCNSRFDLIALADTLIYFGDLNEIFAVIHQALTPTGMCVFTVETINESEETDRQYWLNPSGRYCHNQHYLTNTLNRYGFDILTIHNVTLRTEFGKTIPGLGMLTKLSKVMVE